jgi:peptidyl-prolyl cis-trans isomerase C
MVVLGEETMESRTIVACVSACVMAFACSCRAGEKQEKPKPADTPAAAPAAAVPEAVKAAQGGDMDAVLVTVNGKQFTRRMASDMVREMAVRQGVPPQMADQYLQRAGEQMMRRSVDQFIDQTLVKTEIDRRSEKVTDEEIEKAVEKISQGLPDGLTLTNALSMQGMTMAELREQIVTTERMKKLYDAEAPATDKASDEQIEAFYKENQVHFKNEESAEARHILIACKADASAAARAEAKACAESVRTQLVAGADFAGLAAATSACPSKAKGGSLGTVRRGQMVPAFEKAAFEQEVGAIGPVVETEFGYHVVQVTKRSPGGVTPLKEVSAKIREHLEGRSRDKKFAAYVKGLRTAATIVYPAGANGAGSGEAPATPTPKP